MKRRGATKLAKEERDERREKRRGRHCHPTEGREVAGRWVLVDGERPVLVPPLGSHQPDGHQAPAYSVGPRGFNGKMRRKTASTLSVGAWPAPAGYMGTRRGLWPG